MIKIGLTGGIGSGKSTVSNMIKEKGIPVVDADVISREVLQIYPDIIESIKSTFGKEFVDNDGNLKRRELGNHIFKNENLRKKLEEIIIPYIKKEMFQRIHKYDEQGKELCVVDAPTLIENSIHKDMDFNILVWVDMDTQIKRVKNRDNLDEKQVLNRIKSQMSLEDKKKEVDFIIDNGSDLNNTRQQLEKILSIVAELGRKNEKDKKD